ELVLFSGRLSDRPDHPKVANRSADRLRASLKHRDPQSAPGRCPGVRQTKYSGTGDGEIAFQVGHRTILSDRDYDLMIETPSSQTLVRCVGLYPRPPLPDSIDRNLPDGAQGLEGLLRDAVLIQIVHRRDQNRHQLLSNPGEVGLAAGRLCLAHELDHLMVV